MLNPLGTYETDQCEPCKRHGWTCVRRKPRKNPIQFRPGSRAKYDQAFAPDQVWVKLGRRSGKFFIGQAARKEKATRI